MTDLLFDPEDEIVGVDPVHGSVTLRADTGGFTAGAEVAYLSADVVDPRAADLPRLAGRFEDRDPEVFSPDAGLLARWLWSDPAAKDRYRAVTGRAWLETVALVHEFEVDPAWRGTAASAAFAARIVEFTTGAVEHVALVAAPIWQDGQAEPCREAADRIAGMWAWLGFQVLDVDQHGHRLMLARLADVVAAGVSVEEDLAAEAACTG